MLSFRVEPSWQCGQCTIPSKNPEATWNKYEYYTLGSITKLFQDLIMLPLWMLTQVAEQFECPTNSSQEMADCLRGVNARALSNANFTCNVISSTRIASSCMYAVLFGEELINFSRVTLVAASILLWMGHTWLRGLSCLGLPSNSCKLERTTSYRRWLVSMKTTVVSSLLEVFRTI